MKHLWFSSARGEGTHSASTCMADFVAHLGVTFHFLMGLETHCWLLGYKLVADLLSHLRFSSVGWGVGGYGTISFDMSDCAGGTLGARFLILGRAGDTLWAAWLS